MKKTLAIALALALALSAFAAMAFVLNPGTGSAVNPTASGLVITGFFATDDTAMVTGARVYTDLVNNTDKAYAKNEVIRFAVTGNVLNPAVITNNVAAVDGATMVFDSDTVDLSLSAYPGMVVLHKPFSSTLITAINAVASTDVLKGGTYSTTYNTLTTVIGVQSVEGDASALTATGFDLGSTFAPATTAKYAFAYIFSGVTMGEITEKGLVTMSTAMTDSDTFTSTAVAVAALPAAMADDVSVITKNGRTYLTQKVVDVSNSTTTVKHPVLNTSYGAGSTYTINSTYYLLSKVGYRVWLVTANETHPANYDLTPVAQFDTESVTYTSHFGSTLEGDEVEGIGYSLGLEEIPTTSAVTDVASLAAAPAAGTTTLVFKTVLSDGTVRLVDTTGAAAFTATQLARLNTMMADFGFSIDVNYTYKLEDKYFTTVGAYASTLTAAYNNGTVVPVEASEEPDTQESTGDEDLPDESTVEESVDDGDVIEDETPAETGDFSADIAIVLAAAAVVAAAALAFVMKKVHD